MFSFDTKRRLNIPNDSAGWKHFGGTMEKDLVNNPAHYNKGIETIEYIKSWDISYAQGNVIKYVSRYNIKHQDTEHQIQDLKKALWYIQNMIKDLEAPPRIQTVANPYA